MVKTGILFKGYCHTPGHYDKKVFEMYYEDDNTFRGLGELLDIPMSSIYNTVTRSRTRLVKKFKKDIEVIRAELTSYNECV